MIRSREERSEARRRKERRRGRILLVVLAALAALIAYSAVSRLQGQGTDVAGLSIADYRAQSSGDRRPAPEFDSPSLAGDQTISSSELEGRVLVVNFWASWCGPCRREAPDLEATWRAYEDRGVQFLGVNFRDDRYAARRDSLPDPRLGALQSRHGVLLAATAWESRRGRGRGSPDRHGRPDADGAVDEAVHPADPLVLAEGLAADLRSCHV